MRLRQSRVPALILLLPALQVLATSIAAVDDKPLARAAEPAYPDISAPPNPSLAPTSGPKGTKDAPFDGQDGMPHAGPYINDEPSPTKKKPAIVEELGPKKTIIGPAEPTGEDKVLDGDKSVMQDPDRKLATGNKGTEGGVSAKDKERLAHEDKTGEKLEKVPESPKEAPQLPHSDQKQIQGEVLGTETSSRALGAVGLEVCNSVGLDKICRANKLLETHRSSREPTRHPTPQARLAGRQRPARYDQEAANTRLELARRRSRRCYPTFPLFHTLIHHDHLLRDRRQDLPRGCTDGYASSTTSRLFRRLFRTHRHDRPLCCPRPCRSLASF